MVGIFGAAVMDGSRLWARRRGIWEGRAGVQTGGREDRELGALESRGWPERTLALRPQHQSSPGLAGGVGTYRGLGILLKVTSQRLPFYQCCWDKVEYAGDWDLSNWG